MMNKKLGRLLRPNMGWYISVMLAFTIASAAFGYYLLAGLELVVTAAVFVLYMMTRNRRKKRLQEYIQRHLDETSASQGTKSPFPMLVLRLEDNGIVYANEEFIKLTAFQDNLIERTMEEVLPGFSIEWLTSGKTEYPYDVTLEKRRYRIFGSAIRSEDPNNTMLGVLYLMDLTELYQVRDEYVRSRPVVSIILIDNYDELIARNGFFADHGILCAFTAGNAVLEFLQTQVDFSAAPLQPGTFLPAVQRKIPGDFAEKGREHCGTFGRHGIPGGEIGVADGFLGILPVIQYVVGDGEAVGTVFGIGFGDGLLRPGPI